MEIVSQSVSDDCFVQNPYDFYRTARALGDFVYWKEYDLICATTSQAVNAVLRHPRLGRQTPEELRQPVPPGLEAFYAVEDHSMLELDGPDHTRIRGSVLTGFTRNNVQAMAPRISMMADALIDVFPEPPFDLLAAYGQPLPVQVIADLLGVPHEMCPQLLAWSNAMVAMYQARRDERIEREAACAAADFAAFIGDLHDRRSTEGQDNLISRLANAQQGQPLDRERIVANAILLLNAGHEATVHSIGNAVRLLWDFPERKLALDPENIANTVEECLRFDPPLHMFRRWVYDDVTILGQSFTRGQQIGCLLGSACRDDAIWPDGEVFDPFRLKRPNVAFGAGVHFCIGAPLARLELQIALPALFSRCPDLRVVEAPEVADLYHFHGLKRLIVRV